MWWIPLAGAAASGIGSAVGAGIQADASRENQERALFFQNQWNERNIALQKEFAQHGIRWRMEDAAAAGIHPIAALGAGGAGYSPATMTFPDQGPSPWGDFARGMGQDFGRALEASATAYERSMNRLQLASMQQDVIGKQLQNSILAKQSLTVPSMPGPDNFIPGQAGSAGVNPVPAKPTMSQRGRMAQEAGWRPDVSYSRTDTGLVPMIPEGLSESLEDDFIGQALWRVRNQLMPNITGGGKPPKSQLPAGADDWDYSLFGQEWRPVKGRGSYPWEKWKSLVTRWQD